MWEVKENKEYRLAIQHVAQQHDCLEPLPEGKY